MRSMPIGTYSRYSGTNIQCVTYQLVARVRGEMKRVYGVEVIGYGRWLRPSLFVDLLNLLHIKPLTDKLLN